MTLALLLLLQDPPFPNESAVFDLDQDVTGAARRPQPLSRAPSSIFKLSADDLEKLGMRSLIDTFRVVPGLEVSRISATEVNISARGMNDESSASQGIMGLLDGRQTYNEFLGTVLWEALPVHLQDIESVEVLRGPASFLYGPNSLHGLVNIVTRSPLSYKADRVFLHASGGSYASNMESLIYVRRQGASGLKVKIVRDDIDQFEGRENTRDKVFLEGRFETRLDEHLFDVTAGIGQQKSDVLIAPFSSVAKEVFESRIQDGFLKALYTWKGLRAQASWTRFFSESELREDVYTPFTLATDAADIDLQYAFAPVSGHTVTAGLGYRRASFETQDEDISLGRHATGLGWVFVQDEVELAKTLWITGGLRLDEHSVAGSSFSPRLAAVWEVDDGHTLRASAGIGYRNPSLRELWLNLPVTVAPGPVRFPIEGNRDLEPEKLRSMELAYTGPVLGFLRLRTTVFYSLLDRLIHFVGLGPENNGKERTMGGEAEVDFLLSESFLVFGNATYVVREDRDTGHTNRGAPRTTGNLGLRYTNSYGWAAILWATAFERVQFEDPDGHRLPGEAPGYALLNARVSYSFALDAAKGTLFVQGLNILDHDHREHPHGDSYGALLTAGIDLSW
jgi:iron complex outermembrane recepter protein